MMELQAVRARLVRVVQAVLQERLDYLELQEVLVHRDQAGAQEVPDPQDRPVPVVHRE